MDEKITREDILKRCCPECRPGGGGVADRAFRTLALAAVEMEKAAAERVARLEAELAAAQESHRDVIDELRRREEQWRKLEARYVAGAEDAITQLATARADLAAAVTLRRLQAGLPWGIAYSAAFQIGPAHRDFGHALVHIVKAAGRLSGMVDDADHGRGMTAGSVAFGDGALVFAEADRFIADLVICAARLANVRPGGAVDLERAVLERIEGKNGVKLP